MNFPTYKVRAVSELLPYERNPRTHSAQQIEQLRASIREFGFTNPLLIDENGGIIAGHGRLEAAIAEGLSEIPTIVIEGLSEAQKRALVIADNQLALNAGWDAELLRGELDALKISEFDIDLLGFDDAQLSALSIDGVDDLSVEWAGMPEFEQPDQMPHRSIVIHFRNDADVEAFAKLIAQQFTDKTKSVWYPEAQRGVLADKRYAAT